MKVLTGEQMREVDRATIEAGTPESALMERAGRRVAAIIKREFHPLKKQRVVVFCGKGKNGGDGRVVARLLARRAGAVHLVDAEEPDAQITADMKKADVVVDALLGIGLKGPPRGRVAEFIQAINTQFPKAKVVSVDLPSGLGGGGDCVRADITVTFTAPKVEHFFAEGAAENVGRLIVKSIGSPPELIQSDLEVSEVRDFAPLFTPRKRESHKGDFGHVLVVGGSPGKSGAIALAGLAALRSGAGLVTVASWDTSRLAPELMTETLGGFTLDRKTVIAVGPGLGLNRDLVQRVMREARVPLVLDADALNSIAGTDFRGRGASTILTPHPGEMARLTGKRVFDRLSTARAFAKERNLTLVLKGHHTLIALPDGRVWINSSGSPAMAKGGSGDILTGLIAGLVAQFPRDVERAVRAAVWLHGRAGELAAKVLTEHCVIATDLLKYLPKAIRECVR
ncbi:MAG TPA: NAD(P)H-hydrate dehydratase [Bryobacteraceae bacterium]|nr:NAD(P)H-hydrate dehydratase [Bryobacteraceae bacterium]